MAITLRGTKGSPLTYNELDGNFTHLVDEDTAVRSEFAAADVSVRAAFAAADTAIRGEFAAANAHITDPTAAHADSAITFTPAGTGAVATTVQAKLREFVTPGDFGVVGDGVTDNATALIAMRDYMLEDNDNSYVIKFAPGTYVYSDNKWLMGVKNVTLYAYGAVFKNTKNGLYDRDEHIWYMQHPFEDYGSASTYPGDATAWSATSGYLINDAAAGATTITCFTAAEAGNFTAGALVLLNGFDQQRSGFPPNLRFFEWAEVISANNSTGVVTLNKPLKNTYNADWWDVTISGIMTTGAARIINCDHTWAYTRSLIVKGAKFIINPNLSTCGIAAIGKRIAFIDCDFSGLGSHTYSMSEKVVYDNCIFNSDIEPDKLVENAVYRDCIFKTNPDGSSAKITNCTGHNSIEFQNCYFEKLNFLISPKRVLFDSCFFIDTGGSTSGTSAMFGNNFSTWPTKEIIFRNNVFKPIKTYTGFTIAPTNAEKTITIDSMVGSVILVPKAGNDSLVYNLDHGSFVYLDNMTKYGVVTDIYEYDASNLAITVRSNAAFTAAEVLRWNLCDKNIFYGNRIEGNKKILGETSQRNIEGSIHQIQKHNYSHRNVNFAKCSDFRDLLVLGYIRSIKVCVNKAYSGADSVCRLTISKIVGGSTTDIGYINLKEVGERYVDSLQVLGEQVTDSLDVANMFCLAKQLRCYVIGGAGGTDSVTGDETSWPQFTVEIEYVPLAI